MTIDDDPRVPRVREDSLSKARQALREKAAEQVAKAVPRVFVVRLPSANTVFGWEIRRYGTFVLDRATVFFKSAAEAQAAGEHALGDMGDDRPNEAED